MFKLLLEIGSNMTSDLNLNAVSCSEVGEDRLQI